MKATLRVLNETRWTIVAFAVLGYGMTLLQSIAYFHAGDTFGNRAVMGYTLTLEAALEAVVSPPAVHPETIGGFLQLRAYEPLAILFAAWAAVSATTGMRATVIRAAAFALAATLAVAGACVGTLVGVAFGGGSVSGLGLVEAGVLLVALAAACYAICLIVGQITPAATAIASALLLILFFVNGMGRVVTQLSFMRWLSPFRYYELSAPLPPGGNFDAGGLAALLAITLLGVTAATWISRRRVGRVLTIGSATHQPSRASLLVVPVVRLLYPDRAMLAGSCVTAIALGFVLVAAARISMQDLLTLTRTLPSVRPYIFVRYSLILDETWFDTATLLFAALAFAFVARWAAEDRDGRLGTTLSAPITRAALVIERLAALGLTAAALAVLGGLAVVVMSSWVNLALDSKRLAVACILLAAFGFVLGSMGSLLTAWAPKAAGALLGGVLLAAYLDDQIGGAIGLPAWAQQISPFRLVADPLSNGVDAHSFALLVALAVAGIGSSILLFQRRDVGA